MLFYDLSDQFVTHVYTNDKIDYTLFIEFFKFKKKQKRMKLLNVCYEKLEVMRGL